MRERAIGKEYIGSESRGWIFNLWLEMRPQQWVKNLTVLAPLLFSQQLFNPSDVASAFGAFALFCLLSSSIYVFNDICDREQDRLHPQKRHRPIASGQLSVRIATRGLVVLATLALTASAFIGSAFVFVLLGYVGLNVLYTPWLKHQVILDVFAVATGFVLRVVGGAVAINVEISHWLLLCTSLLALFLGFSKRRHELLLLKEEAGAHREVLGEYDPQFLDMMIGIVTAATVMSYALYTVSEETVAKFHTRGLLLTLPFVLYGIFRYLYLVYHKDLGGDPTQVLLTDRPLIVNTLLWALTATVILYWH
ncbi:MAG: decaprenyl-phosphate phosphoribosyltransferase [Candidatus Binatia bacterium]